MRKARIIKKQGNRTPNGTEVIFELRRGKKGKGKLLCSVIAWPWSRRSMEKAPLILDDAAANFGFEIVDEMEGENI